MVAFGQPCYGRAAYNMAISIKNYDPDLQICLLHDTIAFSKSNFDMSIFDTKISLGDTDIKDPAKIKTSIYDYLPYEHNLYLDVDGLALQSLTPLLERCIQSEKNYLTYVYETYDETSPDIMPMMYWAYRKDIWEHFNLNGHKLPATQSSIQYIKKCEENKNLFDKLKENFNNPIPLSKLRNVWGGTQPDELYLDVTLAQLNLNPHIGNDAMFFANLHDKRSLTQLKEDHFILSIFGGKGFTRGTYKDWYDRLMIGYCRKRGHNHVFKINYVLQNKHADNKNSHSISRKVPV